MSFNRKFKKLIRDPKLFFHDAANNKKKQEPKKQEPKKQEPKKQEPKKQEQKKQEPSVLGTYTVENNIYNFNLSDKKVINVNLGFSTLVILDESQQYLINRRYASNILKDRDFIAFREKSVFFLYSKVFSTTSIYNHNRFNNFLNNNVLRGNKFKDFRNIVVFNPLNDAFVLIRQSNPNLKIICIVTSHDSLVYLHQYIKYIDILIVDSVFDITAFTNVPRILKYESIFNLYEFSQQTEKYPSLFINTNNFKLIEKFDSTLIDTLKLALIDTSYKKDCDLLLPVLSSNANLANIDQYNEDTTVEGLVRYSVKFGKIATFDDFIENIEIEELYLRDHLYSVYKDLILKNTNFNNFKPLLRKTLYDGVCYEKI
jgi:hypothetical protein